LLRKLETEKAALDRGLPKQEQALARTQREGQMKLSNLERQIQESQQAQSDLEQVQLLLATATRSLTSGDFAALEQAQLQELERQMQSLGYDELARQQSYNEIQRLQPLEEKQRQLSHALTQLPREEESLTRSQDMLLRRRRELADLEERRRTGEEAVAALPQWQASLQEAELALTQLERSQQAAVERRGYLEGQLRRLEELKQEIDTSSATLVQLQEDQIIYQELVNAFGRQGVQAMLIETVLPRLEEEANTLLGRMTDNRMHLKLETQRERRTGRGDPIETLEIKVSDELGPRNYEMYSGGEAFRVNLALRIALSRVLSQRMGAPLPTLFIDEGFGTQDTAGRERIIDVISAIRDDFKKIIVITHLDDLKDMFDARIEVQKDGSGSTFWLS
jgi:exonuclease SbcC